MAVYARRVRNLSLLVTVSVLALVAIWQRDAIYDWARLRDYTPSVAVVNLATQDTMNDYGRHMFYVNHPQLMSDGQQFDAQCNQTEKTIVLGCYRPPENGIFLFNVSDPRLAGIQQVTAAHEMLHAAYERLSSKDRTYVDGLLEDYFKNKLGDDRIKRTMELYRQTEPNDVVNEMHSVFGTEIANLTPELEAYYKRYFSNRQAVASFAAVYQAEFSSREDQIRADDDRLSALKKQIDAQKRSLDQLYSQIQSDKAELDRLRSSNQVDAYNSRVDAYNAEIDRYRAQVNSYNSNVDEFNSILDQQKSIAGELRTLYSAIDSRPPTAEKQ